MVLTKNKDTFVVADIPGLIEGAHQGSGLGHEFLRHIERTRVLLFILDTAQTEGRDVLQDYNTLRQELELYQPDLKERPYLIAANKMDVPEAQQNYEKLRMEFGDRVYAISAVTGQGIEPLVEETFRLLQTVPRDMVVRGEEPVVRRFEEEEPFVIANVNGVFEVSGKRIEKLLAMTNFNTDEGLQRFQRTIERMGLEDALREKGVKVGDTVKIADLEFEYNE